MVGFVFVWSFIVLRSILLLFVLQVFPQGLFSYLTGLQTLVLRANSVGRVQLWRTQVASTPACFLLAYTPRLGVVCLCGDGGGRSLPVLCMPPGECDH